MLELDFFADARAYIDGKQNREAEHGDCKSAEPVPATKTLEQTENLIVDYEVFPALSGFSIADDCKTFIYNNNVYTIPDFYNKEMIRQKDSKTLDMIFKGLGLVY